MHLGRERKREERPDDADFLCPDPKYPGKIKNIKSEPAHERAPEKIVGKINNQNTFGAENCRRLPLSPKQPVQEPLRNCLVAAHEIGNTEHVTYQPVSVHLKEWIQIHQNQAVV